MSVDTSRQVANAVTLRSVRRDFGSHTAVQSLDLDIAEGEFFSLIGPSGCGKTTTLRMVAGLEQPTAGHIRVRDKNMTGVPAFRRPVHTVFQNYALFPHLNVLDNVQFGLREKKVRKSEAQSMARRALRLVNLEGREQLRPRQLSGGMQQRVALARALVLEPEVLLLDEPLGALDLKLRRQMQVMLKQVQREVGITFIYVTHDQEEAFSMSDRVGIMNAGRLVQVATPHDLYEYPATRFVADFVGSSNQLTGVIHEQTQQGYVVKVSDRVLPAAGAPGLEKGQDCICILRPENARLQSASECEVTLTGVVDDVSYVGSHSTVTVETPMGTAMTVSCPSRHLGSGITTGSTVSVGWSASDLWVVGQ